MERKPDIPSHLVEYVSAFGALSSRRQVGFNEPNPISMADILAYANLLYKNRQQIDLFVQYMIIMDGEFIRHVRSQRSVQNSTGIKNG